MSAEFRMKLSIKDVLATVIGVGKKSMTDLAEETVSIAKSDHTFENQTGTNESSITWDEDDGDVKVYTQSGYGGYVELKLPYIYPALEQARGHIKKNVEGKI